MAADIFERACTVEADGGTTPVTLFAVAGRSPRLFPAFPEPITDFSTVSAWFRNGEAAPRFITDTSGATAGQDRLWLRVPAWTWTAQAAPGQRHGGTTMQSLELVLIDGVGVDSFVATQTGSANVCATAAPSLSAWMLTAFGLTVVPIRRRRPAGSRRRQPGKRSGRTATRDSRHRTGIPHHPGLSCPPCLVAEGG